MIAQILNSKATFVFREFSAATLRERRGLTDDQREEIRSRRKVPGKFEGTPKQSVAGVEDLGKHYRNNLLPESRSWKTKEGQLKIKINYTASSTITSERRLDLMKCCLSGVFLPI